MAGLMETTRSPGAGSGNSGTYSPDMAESLRFEEEIQSIILQPQFEPPPVTGGGGSSSFTALLGLAPYQAVELLHDPPLPLPLACPPTFPSNAALVDRAARFSVFASASPSDSADVPPPPTKAMKSEPADSVEKPHRAAAAGVKRKEAEKNNANGKVKGSAKKSKSAEEATGGDEKLPYVHVRARRGQATDSHSLAERARREKINARMKLLQELVPGCSKISGTALVLDEIIHHVQSLQRQVEFLSMRLAAVNPRLDFSGLVGVLNSEISMQCGRPAAAGARPGLAVEQASAWLEGVIEGEKQQQQEMWPIDSNQHHHQQQQQMIWDRDDSQQQQGHVFVGSASTAPLFGAYDSPNPSPGPLATQLKTEL